MTIVQCKYVIAIANYGSFSEAAKKLFVAQSSLSVSVKALEDELGITIFERVPGGVYLTENGSEFIRYAIQMVEQHDFIVSRYTDDDKCQKLYIVTQHYDFVADIFGKMLREVKEDKYKFSLIETTTNDVINKIETAYSDIGILAIKGNDAGVMKRYLFKRNIKFTPVIKVFPHVFLRKEHPLAKSKVLSFEQLLEYPFVSYEQGEHNNSFFTEEISAGFSDKHIEIGDRASLMNVLLTTDSYTIGTGIMPSSLNEGKIISVPLKSSSYYNIGYILHSDRRISEMTEKFIKLFNEMGI